MISNLRLRLAVAAILLSASFVFAQDKPVQPMSAASAEREFEVVSKQIDDVLWYMKLGDVAKIDKYRIASSKPVRMANPTGQGAGNPLIFYVYVFTPKNLKGKAPMLVIPHGGVHGDTPSFYYHIFGEMLAEGYVIVCPEYRGSTGYGAGFYNQIDYGGAEIDDTHDARNWAVENLPQVDGKHVGIAGWSHGGYHALMNIFFWPDDYQAAYAGVPVSDLVARMGYKDQEYRDIFKGFIGKEADQNPMEYKKRSPYYYAEKLRTPLLIHTNTNDEDVNVMEVEHLIDSLKAAGKKFEYKIYQNAPGGHAFNRIDTRLAVESRREVYSFLAKYLK